MALEFGTVRLDALEEKLAAAAEGVEKTLGAAQAQSKIKAALDKIGDDAKARVHNITGALSRSIKSRVKVSADSPTLGEVGVRYKGTKMRYAHLVEGGHGGPHGPADPHPFWAPAVEATAEDAMQVLTEIAGELADDLLK